MAVYPDFRNGDSIGVSGDANHSGTLGGFVVLRHTSSVEPRLCGVTCHHVAREEERGLEAFKEALVKMNPGDPSRISMQSPSLRDYMDTIAELEKEEKVLRPRIKELEEARVKQDDFLTPIQQRQFNQWTVDLQQWTSQIDVLRTKAGPLGGMIASSGLRISEEGHNLDWSLVEVEKHQFSANYPPERRDLPWAAKESDKAHAYFTTGEPATCVEDMKFGDFVTMKGRTSGVVAGEVHKVLEEMRLGETQGIRITREMVIIAVPGNKTPKPVFSGPGDSGSFIYNERGSIVGLQISHMEPKFQYEWDETIATPIAVVFGDIESLTGGKIQLPSA